MPQPGNMSISTPNGYSYGYYATVSPFGGLSVAMEPTDLFSDPFDSTGIDVANRWTSGGTVPPTEPAGGGLLVNSGTAASATTTLVSQPTILLSNPLAFAAIVTLEASTAKGNHRWWGFGTQPGTWTALLPVQDGVGFELDTLGQLRASVYSSGTRVYTQTITAPTDGNPHLYFVAGRPGAFFFFMDNTEIPISPIPAQATPSIQALPVRLHSINGLSTTTGTPTMTVTSTGAVDISRSTTKISDGLFPWRRASVSASGALAVREGAATAVQGPSSWTVNTTAQASVVAADPTRTVLVFNSVSTSTVYIRYDATLPTVAAGGFHDVIPANGRLPAPKEVAGQAVSMIGSAVNGAINIMTSTAP